MFVKFVCAVALAAALAGCAGDPYQGIARERPGDRVEDRPDAQRVAALVRVATATAEAGDYANAVAMYRRAHEADPYDAQVMIGLGGLLLRLGANVEAADVFKKAVANEGGAAAHEGLGKALIGLDQPEAAISHLKAALEIAESPGTYSALGVAHDLAGDHGGAQAYYRTGLDIAPGNVSLQNNLGLSLAVSGRHGEAIALLRQAAAGAQATARHRLNLALAYGLAGDIEAAAEIARIDLDERSVQQNLAFYETLRALKDSRATIRAIGAHNARIGTRPGERPVRQTSQR